MLYFWWHFFLRRKHNLTFSLACMSVRSQHLPKKHHFCEKKNCDFQHNIFLISGYFIAPRIFVWYRWDIQILVFIRVIWKKSVFCVLEGKNVHRLKAVHPVWVIFFWKRWPLQGGDSGFCDFYFLDFIITPVIFVIACYQFFMSFFVLFTHLLVFYKNCTPFGFFYIWTGRTALRRSSDFTFLCLNRMHCLEAVKKKFYLAPKLSIRIKNGQCHWVSYAQITLKKKSRLFFPIIGVLRVRGLIDGKRKVYSNS